MVRSFPGILLFLCGICGFGPMALLAAPDDPPAINPFGTPARAREDAVPGYIELSDGTIHPGQIYLTRDARLKIYDEKMAKAREVPLEPIERIDCGILKEWMEKEWRFKENANDVKVYTGRAYPAREYVYTITLRDGRKIKGPLQAIVYVQGDSPEPKRFQLHKRDKGELETDLKSLLYVRSVHLGEKAYEEGKEKKAAPNQDKEEKPGKGPTKKEKKPVPPRKPVTR